MIRYLKDNPEAFGPDTVQILDIAWQTIEIDKPALKLDGNAARAREVLAKQIVDLAKLGERDPQRLADGALARFTLAPCLNRQPRTVPRPARSCLTLNLSRPR
jgi:hypothetical protein